MAFCIYQAIDSQGFYCLAHLHEGMTPSCPYADDRTGDIDEGRAKQNCMDYKLENNSDE